MHSNALKSIFNQDLLVFTVIIGKHNIHPPTVGLQLSIVIEVLFITWHPFIFNTCNSYIDQINCVFVGCMYPYNLIYFKLFNDAFSTDRDGWCNGNAVDLYPRGIRFEFLLGYRLPWHRILWYSLGKYLDIISK